MDLEREERNSGTFMPQAATMPAFLSKTYGWMCFALLLTALTAWFVGHNEAAFNMLMTGHTPIFLILAELGVVFFLSAHIDRMAAQTATILFVVYSILNGITMSVLLLVYTQASVVSTFGICAITFGAMSLYGYTTKRDLSSIGRILFFGLIGLIIATLVNMFLHSGIVETIASYAGVIIFIGLTAYDTQKIKEMGYQIGSDGEDSTKYAVLAALTLYLDFINLFIYLLRIFGNRRN